MNTESTDPPPGLPAAADDLGNIPVLIVDCQGDADRLVEIAWSTGSAKGGWSAPRSFLVEVEGPLSPMFRRLTGITDADLGGARTPGEVAGLFLEDLARSKLAVAHACRYEAHLLAALPGIREALPPDGLVCTAELSRRLLPGLSGFGLRAVCGYLGLHVDPLRRAAAHVEATARIWEELLGILIRQGLPMSGFMDLLRSPPPDAAGRLSRLPEGWRKDLPDRPGVYRLGDFSGRDLYIGKAASLRRRIPQHFHRASWKSKDGMSSSICRISVEVCETELEAALLEAALIEEARPQCNRALSAPPPEVAWFSRDLARSSPERRRGFPLGPHSALGPMRDLRSFRDALASGDPGILRESCVRLGEFAPGPFSSGFDLFCSAHPDCASGDAGRLLRLASRIDVGNGDEEESEGGEVPESERAFRALEAIVASCGAAARRARWYILLACSVLRYEAPGGTRELSFCGGEVAGANWASPDAGPSVHPASCRGAGSIRPSAYRRLGLLTGEIRKLIPARAKQVLDRDRLERLLERL
jgi:DNA polymerase III epsilon subunit-like protein